MEDEILEFTYKRAQKKLQVEQPEVWLNVEIAPIEATSNRRLKAVWSYEAAQDLRSQHNIDATQSLCDLMAKEMLEEMDREIIRDLEANYKL